MNLELTLHDIEQATGGAIAGGDSSAIVRSLSTDTRQLRPGEWFLALRGENFDGHDFLELALAKGAAGLIFDRRLARREELGRAPAALAVDDTLWAYGAIAQAWRRRLDPQVACIVGSGGKTTTKEMAGRALQRLRPALVSERNLNNLIGAPQTLLHLERGHECVVMELGMNALGELRRLTEIADPDVALLTNIGNAHIGMFGSIEGLIRAKSETLEAMRPGTRLLANADCPRSAQAVRRSGGHLDVVHFGRDASARYRAEAVERLSPWGYSFRFVHPGGSEAVAVRAFGRHNVDNALAAAALLCELGVDAADAAAGVSQYAPEALRSHAEWVGGALLIEDCYNASPAAMESAVASLADVEIDGWRHVALGDMLEIGEYEEELHRQAGRAAARLPRARLYCVGERARWIAEGARSEGAPAEWFASAAEASEAMGARIQPGDLAFFKASRLMRFEELALSIRKRLEK